MDNINLTKKVKPKKVKRDRYGEDYEFSPVRQYVSDSTLYGGIAIRALAVAMLNLGLLLFFNDCFELGAKAGLLAIFSIAWTMAFSLILVGKKMSLIGLGIGIATGGIWFVINMPLASNIMACFECTVNTIGKTFIDNGYDNMSFLLRSYSSLSEPAQMNTATLFVASAAFALVLSLSNIRRTLLIPTALLTIVICVPGITYNFADSNWGFAFVLLSLFAIVTMKFFDRAYKAKKADRLRRASLGGYVGGAVAIIALICISIPAMLTNTKWADIPAISGPMSVARDVVTSVISGDMPNLQEMGIIRGMDEQNSRSVAPKKITITGKSMLSVKRNSISSAPLYLRGWVASGKFDGYIWQSPTNDTLALYEQTLSSAAADAGYEGLYSPDYMTEAFYGLLGEDYLTVNESGYGDHSKNGYLMFRSDVSMNLGTGTGNLIYIPSMSSLSSGLYAFEGDSAYRGVINPFYDGMVLTNWFNLDKSYSVDTFATNFSKEGADDNFMELIKYANAVRDFIRFSHDNPSVTGDALRREYTEILLLAGVKSELIDFSFYDRYISLDDSEKLQYYNKYVVLCDTYTEYANKTYGYDARYTSETILNLVYGIRLEEDDTQHDIVLKTIQHIVSNYKYTVDPKIGTYEGFTPYERFLAETKEGYCTQFATTLTLLLRAQGIPARYVEGFIAKDFKMDENGNYVSNVTDENAHAWVEVYYPGYGWLTYEASNRYARNYYGSSIRVGGSSIDMGGNDNPGGSTPPLDDTPTDIVPPNDDTPSDEIPKKEIPWGKIARITIVIAVVVGGGYLLIKYLKKRGDETVYARKQQLQDAINGIDSDEYRDTSHEINETLFGMMRIAGYAPKSGELPMQFAKRIDEECAYVTHIPFSPIMQKIQSQEFGMNLSPVDLREIAEYTKEFWNDLYRSLAKPKQIWYRYIRRYL